MAKFYANPYNISCSGFYFQSMEEFDKKVGKVKDPHTGMVCEEFSIEYIDGTDEETALWQAVGPKVAYNMQLWFDELEDLSEEEMATLAYVVGDLGYDVQAAMDMEYSAALRAYGSAEDYVYDLIDDIGIESITGDYFNYDSFGRDMRLSGDSTSHLYSDMEYAQEQDDEDEVERLQEEINRIEGLDDQELGYDYVESVGSLADLGKETQKMYFDYKALARDMVLNSEITEYNFAGTAYIMDQQAL